MEIGDQSRDGIRSEERNVEVEGRTQFQQHGDGQRALIALELVEVARRQVERDRQRGLGQSALVS